MKRLTLSLSAFLVLLGSSQFVLSKGSPNEIRVCGGGLTQPIQISDKRILKGFDPWLGQFIDWSHGIVADTPTGEAYKISFYIKWKRTDRNLKLFYEISYVPGKNGERGYVYLPGRDDKWGCFNAGTIIRDADDGRWHYASAKWDALMESLVPPHD